jgi:hypothetical protein
MALEKQKSLAQQPLTTPRQKMMKVNLQAMIAKP